MYNGWQHGKAPSNEWIDQTTEFFNHAFSFMGVIENETIKCPCAMCRNYFRHKRHAVELHLCKFGFREDYETWTEHGETLDSHCEYRPMTMKHGQSMVRDSLKLTIWLTCYMIWLPGIHHH